MTSKKYSNTRLNVFTFFKILHFLYSYCQISSFQIIKHAYFTTLHLLQETNCVNATDTIEDVAICPESKTSDSFKERSERKNCSQYPSCNGKQLYYHCVRYNKRIVEVCSEKEIIIGKYL